jgi:hypothetical protein
VGLRRAILGKLLSEQEQTKLPQPVASPSVLAVLLSPPKVKVQLAPSLQLVIATVNRAVRFYCLAGIQIKGRVAH